MKIHHVNVHHVKHNTEILCCGIAIRQKHGSKYRSNIDHKITDDININGVPTKKNCCHSAITEQEAYMPMSFTFSS